MLTKMVLNSYPQVIHPPRPPKVRGYRIECLASANDLLIKFYIYLFYGKFIIIFQGSGKSLPLSRAPINIFGFFFLVVFCSLPNLIFAVLPTHVPRQKVAWNLLTLHAPNTSSTAGRTLLE